MTPKRESLFDFDRARRKAFVQSILNLITRKSLDLLPFGDVREQLRLRNSHFRGLQDVPLDQIVGSVGRYRDFTRTFLPRLNELRERWARVEDQMREGGLAPIELYKVGDAYFVRDGNHRVSVARTQNAPSIEAYVWEYPSLVPLGPNDNLDDLLNKRGYVEFLEKTRLNQLRPDQRIEFTTPGRYRDLLAHIEVHRHFLAQQHGRDISDDEAVTGWFDDVYRPIVNAIRQSGILKRFPERTEADLYIWIWRWQQELSAHYNRPVSAADAVDEFATGRSMRDQ